MSNKEITSTADLKSDDIVYIGNDSTYRHPMSNEFVFAYKNNKLRVNLKGGNPKPKCGLAMWKIGQNNGSSVSEEMHTYGYFDMKHSDDIMKDPFGYARTKILPFDATPLSPLRNILGYRAIMPIEVRNAYFVMLYYPEAIKPFFSGDSLNNIYQIAKLNTASHLFELINELNSKNTSLFDLILNEYQCSDYILYRAIYEKLAVDLLDDKNARIYFANIYEGKLNGNVVAIIDGREKMLSTFVTDKLTKPYMDIKLHSSFWKETDSDLLYRFEKNERSFVLNTTPHFLKIQFKDSYKILKPYGIVPLDKDIVKVYQAPRITAKLSYLESETNAFMASDENPSVFGGYVINSSSYFINKSICNLNSDSSTIQFGPFEIDATSIEIINNNTIKTADGTMLSYSHNDLYYKYPSESEFRKAIPKSDGYYDENGKKTAKRLVAELEVNVVEDNHFIYHISYKRRPDGKLYKIYHKAVNPYGFELYNRKNFKAPNVCDNTDFPKIDTSKYKAADVIRVKNVTECLFESYSAIDGEWRVNSTKLNYFPGLYSEEGMCIIGGGIITENIASIGAFNKLRSHRDNNGKAVYFVVKQEDGYKLIAFPLTEEKDAFIDIDNSSLGQCMNPKKKGTYECKIDPMDMPHLLASVGDYEPSGTTLSEIKEFELPSGVYLQDIHIYIKALPADKDLIKGIKPLFMAAVDYSYIMEFVDNYRYSYVADKKLAVCKEIGLVLDNDKLDITEDFTISIIKDKNKRGVELVANDVRVTIDVSGAYHETKILSIHIYKGDKEILSHSAPFMPFLIKDKNSNTLTHGIFRQLKNTELLYFSYEGFINYLVDNKVFVNILVDADENNGIIDEENIEFSIDNNTNQGSKLKATLNGQELDIINTPATAYYIKTQRAYPVYGEFKIVAKAKFLYSGFGAQNNGEFIEKILNRGFNEVGMYFGYELYRPVNIYMPYRLLYDTRFLALENKKFTVPKDQRVGVQLYTGYKNRISATKEFNTTDNIYERIDGMVFKDCIEGDIYHVNYAIPVGEYILNRDIQIDLNEQASFFDTYYNNAKTQLMQDVREDTPNKRYKGAFVKSKFDTQEIYNEVKTLEADLWAIPVAFRCADMPNEAALKPMLLSERLKGKDLDYDTVLNQMASKMVFFDNCSEVELSALNKVFESDTYASYDFTDIYSRYTNKELLYNESNIKSYEANENMAKGDLK